MSIYKVTGSLNYRDHTPQTVFEAVLEPDAEARAIERGNITLIERSTPALIPGSYRLPDGWAVSHPRSLEGVPQ